MNTKDLYEVRFPRTILRFTVELAGGMDILTVAKEAEGRAGELMSSIPTKDGFYLTLVSAVEDSTQTKMFYTFDVIGVVIYV